MQLPNPTKKFVGGQFNVRYFLEVCANMNRAEKRRQQKLAEKTKKSAAHNNPGEDHPLHQQQLAILQALERAMAHHEAGHLSEAEGIYLDILEVEPVHPVANNLLGVIANQKGNKEKAWTLITQALDVAPDYPEAHSNLGHLLTDLGQMEEAIESYQKALVLKPDFAEAHFSLGNALRDLGKLEEAVASYQKALAVDPDFARAHYNLGLVLNGLGRDEALTSFRKAVFLRPHNNLFWNSLAAFLEIFSFSSVDDRLWVDLLLLLERPTVRPSYVQYPIISALFCHPDFSEIFKSITTDKPKTGINFGDLAEQLSGIPLFLRIMELGPIHDLKIERMLTLFRRELLEETMAKQVNGKGLPFSAALALQCFTNEYIFPETSEETNLVQQLQAQISSLVDIEQDVPPSWIAAFGAYRPLYRFPWARELDKREWTDSVEEIIKRQISEPLEEQSFRDNIPSLTPIENTVSLLVREQYEENPYPRWVKTNITERGRSIGEVLQGAPLRFDIGDFVSPESPEILIAGCGTGQNSLNTSTRFANARVLAVDLSLSSLSYAMRKTKELGFTNIEYAQADIMELADCGRSFDLIESSGVLHHLGDPLAGWRVLVDLLRPGGFMKICLYSEAARQDIVCGRSLIAEMGYTTSPKDICQCRQAIITKAEGGNPEMLNIFKAGDFFSLSECRDLLFHVQEHRFTLPQIEAALKTLNLKFLGFEMRYRGALKEFVKTNPNRDPQTALSRWHEFECNNPNSFLEMYQFWCKKL